MVVLCTGTLVTHHFDRMLSAARFSSSAKPMSCCLLAIEYIYRRVFCIRNDTADFYFRNTLV